jgi:hypothetical protein
VSLCWISLILSATFAEHTVSVVLLSVVMLNVVMLSAIYAEYTLYGCFAECGYAEFR